jgi:hypothetical protein
MLLEAIEKQMLLPTHPFLLRERSVSDVVTVLGGVAVVLFFIWRFIRTHKRFRYSHRVLRGLEEPVEVQPAFSREFFDQAILGNRNAKPNSFYVRAIAFAVIALILLPFRDYSPLLYSIYVGMTVAYVPWCVSHGYILGKMVTDEAR